MSTAQPLQQAWPTPKSPIPVVMIGAGGIVNDAYLPAYRKAGFPVAGIFDENRDRARATAERWNIARAWSSLDEAIADTAARKVIFDVGFRERA